MKGEPGLPLGKHQAVSLAPSLINAPVAAIIYVLVLKVAVIALTAMVINNINRTKIF